MTDTTVTQLVIDSDPATQGASQFSAAMDSCAAAVSKTLGSLGDLNGGLGDTVGGFAGLAAILGGGVTAAILGVTGYIKSANSELANMQQTAHLVGLSLADFQGVQFGGQTNGLTPDQVNAGLEKSSQLLNDAQRNANTLSKELDANGLSIKNANGQLISENQLLGIAADLIRRAQSPADQVAIAQMLGFTKEWIPLLEQGSGAIAALTDEAKAAGAVIDDETIQKAADFNAEWKKSSTAFSLNMKAALADLLPYFDDLITRAQNFIKTIDASKIQSAVDEQNKALTDGAGLPAGGGVKIDVSDETKHALKDFQDATPFTLEFWSAAGKALASAITSSVSTYSRNAPESYPVSQDPMNADAYLGSRRPVTGPQASSQPGPQSIDAITKAWDAEQDAAQDAAEGFSKVAARGKDTNDILDRAIYNLEKHTAQTVADTEAIGLGSGALEEFRANAALLTAAQQNGTVVTQALADKFQDLAQDARDAKQAYDEQQAAAKANFDLQIAGLTGVEAQIAQLQYKLHGDDWQSFMNDGLAATTRLADALKTLNQAETQFATGFVDGLLRGQTAMQSLSSASQSLITTLSNKNLQNLMNGGSLFGSQDLASPQGALAIGAAGAAGYSSGNMLTGALGGALAGATFGPVGALAGAAVGLAGSLFGASEKSKQELQAAQDAWSKAGPAFQKFLGDMTGTPAGSISDTLQAAYTQGQDLAGKAMQAGHYEVVDELISAYNQYAATLKNNFKALFQVTIDGLESGLGPNSPLLQAAQSVGTALTAAQDFLGNVKTSFGGTDTLQGGNFVSGATSSYATQYAQAQKAEQDYLLSLLQTPPALSTVQQAMLKIQGTATALQGALEQLGLSSGAAAAAIQDGVTKAVDALAATFSEGLTARLNTANGQDYLNTAQALLTQHAQDLSDAAVLGNNPALLAQVQATFAAEAQKIVNDANLTGAQFSAFINLFPQFSSVVTQSTATLTQSIATITSYLQSLQVGTNSILSPQDQLSQSEANFQQQFALAKGGDSTALSGITQYATTLLGQAKSFYASGSGYADIYNVVVAALQSLTGPHSVSVPTNTSLFGGSTSLASPAATGSVVPQVTQLLGGSAANDNGAYFAQQTTALSQVFAQVGQAQIIALQAGIADLGRRVDQVTAAINANRGKPLRPASKTGTG